VRRACENASLPSPTAICRFGALCGESGCGKTSFLQAGLWPRLLKQNHRCVYVKFTEADPLDSIRRALAETFQQPPRRLAADLPAVLATAAPTGSPPLVLLFDQFEQFFVHRRRTEEREPFVKALAEWYGNRQGPPVRILICLRDDFYGRLIELQKAMGYSLGPQQSLRLEKFTPSEAAAVFRVIAETEGLPCDEEFVQELTARELASREDGLVSAVDLQILAWVIRGQRSVEERAFNRTAFQRLGGLEGLLERFLSRALEVRETEVRRQAALKVLLALTDLERNARAGALSPEEMDKRLAGTMSPGEVRETLEWLARGDVRLATPVEREDGRGYELAHERLIPALRRLAGRELSAADQANQLLDRRVNEWLGNDRARRYLLTWRDWRRIRRQQPFLEWGARKRQKEALLTQARQYWRRRVGAASLLALLLLSVVVLWFSPWGQIWLVKRELGSGSSVFPGLVLDVMNTGDVVKAGALVEQGRQAAEEISDPRHKAERLKVVAGVRGAVGAWTAAGALLDESRQAAEEIGNPRDKAWTLRDLAEAVAAMKNPAKAAALIEQARQAAEEIGDRWDKARTLASLAEVTKEIGDPVSAAALIEQARKAAGDLGDTALTMPVPEDLTWLLRERDPVESSARVGAWRWARQIAEEYPLPDDRARALATILEVWAEGENPGLGRRPKGR
jgi:tetratricopeptide (TPR) repeat protein